VCVYVCGSERLNKRDRVNLIERRGERERDRKIEQVRKRKRERERERMCIFSCVSVLCVCVGL